MIFRHKQALVLLIFMIVLALPSYTQDNPDEYKKTIEMADSYFSKGDYINAKASYQIAIRLAPGEQYPKDRLQQSLDMIKVQMYQNSLYTQKIQVADDLFRKNDFDGALSYYQEALSILPGDVYATTRIQEINRSQIDSQQLEADYQKSIAAGDQYYKEKKLEKALIEYRNASALKPSESYPKEKAIETEALIAEGKNITGEYEAALQSAELSISRNKYDEAITYLEKAINLLPNEPLPKQKLAEAQNLKAAWDSYTSIIHEADEYYVSKEFELAGEKYLQAQAIKPGDDYPKSMLEKIEIALMDLEQANRSSYEFTIQKADELFNQKDYEQAMVEYKKAILFKPDEAYAKQRINDINNALNLRKSQEEAYSQAIARADIMFKEEKYDEAKNEYNNAIGIKPLEQYPKVKIEEINTIQTELSTKQELYKNLIKGADRLFFSDEYVEAREQYRQASYIFPKEQYPLDQITMINEILGQRDTYIKAVTRADQLFYQEDYEAALLEFRNASALQPDEDYPREKIKEIEAIIASIKVEPEEYQEALETYQKEQVYEFEVDSSEIKAMQAMESQYSDLVSSADDAFKIKDYTKALEDYQTARNVKPGEVYAEGKIKEINAILAELAIAQKALDKQYSDAIATADQALQAKDYQKALGAYQSAASLKPGEAYPKGRITEINAAMGEIAAKEALDKQYSDAIATADQALQAKDYQKALSAYQSAASLKPQEPYVKDKILEIETVMEEQAKQLEIENQYIKVIAQADEYLKNEQFEEAKVTYNEAQSIKPSEDYPGKQILHIDRTLETQALERDQAYQNAITKADIYFEQKNYEMARVQYDRALQLKPGDMQASEKIRQVNEQVESQRKLIQQQYDQEITKADNFFASKVYDDAIASYRAASLLKPDEGYPKEMAGKILKLLSERSIYQLNNEPLLISNNSQHKFDFLAVPAKDRRSNYIFFTARNLSNKEYKLIISFGEGQTKNGGVVIKVPAGENMYEFVVRISAQYKWFSDDNNWITFYPEGGDLEVSLMQISYSD